MKTIAISKKRRNIRSRSTIFGESDKPRICVFRSNAQIYVQAISDRENKILASASSLKLTESTKTEKSKIVGAELGDKLINMNIKSAMFDRNGYRFHGRVKAVVEGIREKGIYI